jgi:AcrR family transcriptional regulator
MSLVLSAPRRPDGRHQRSQRTKEAITEAFLGLLRETQEVPTASQIAERAGCSTRTVFGRFKDFAELSVATCDYVIAHRKSTPVGNAAEADRPTRLRFQVETRARSCEAWLPLWRMLVRYQERVPELKMRVEALRRLSRERLTMLYRPELTTLAETERDDLLIALEAVTEFESWGRMRERHRLSFDAACAVWVKAIDRLLPATPTSVPA